jgi:hypothetical protein
VDLRTAAAAWLLTLIAVPGPAAVLEVPGAHATLKEALEASAEGDTVVVASGEYRAADLTVPDGVVLRAAPQASVTLKADRKSRHLSIAGRAVIEGIVFREGAARTDRQPSGGSIQLAPAAQLTLRNCTFVDCDSRRLGGAIHGDRDGVILAEGCTFEHTIANLPRGPRTTRREPARQSYGGAIHVGRDGRLEATGCRFLETSATGAGGAVYADRGSTAALRGCTFEGGHSNNGGAINAEQAALTVEDCTFTANTTESEYADPGLGGAIRLIGGSLQVTGSRFTGNISARGGALGTRNADSVELSGNRFSDNEAEAGGAVSCVGGTLTIRDGVFLGNRSIEGGGAAVLALNAHVVVQTSTFHGNVARRDGSSLNIVNASDAPRVDRCLFSGGHGSAAVLCTDGPRASIKCSLVYGHDGGDWVGDLALAKDKDDNLSADPKLLAPDDGDVTPADDSPALGGDCGRIGAPASVTR